MSLATGLSVSRIRHPNFVSMKYTGLQKNNYYGRYILVDPQWGVWKRWKLSRDNVIPLKVFSNGIFNVLYGLVSTLKNSCTFGYRFTIGFSYTVIPQLMYSYFTAWLAPDRQPELWAGPPAPGCPFPCFSTDSVNSWAENCSRGWVLIHRLFPS